MKNKTIAILLVFSILFTLTLTACGSNNSENTDEGTYLTYYVVGDGSIYTELIEKYNKHCWIYGDEKDVIKIKEFETNKELIDILSAELMTGRGPDIITLDYMIPFEKLMKTGVFSDINTIVSDYCSEINFEDYNQVVMDCGMYEDKRYILPLFYCPDVFFTTEKQLQKVGLSADSFSYESLAEALPKHQGELYFSLNNWNFFYNFVDCFVDLKHEKNDIKSEEFIKALDYVRVLMEDCEPTDDMNDIDTLEKTAMLKSPPNTWYGASPLNFTKFQNNNYSNNDEIVVLNNFTKSGEMSSYVEMGFAINENCKHKDKALKFIEYTLSNKCQGYWCGERLDETGFNGANYISLPVKTSVYERAVKNAYEYQADTNEDGTIDETETRMNNEKNRVLEEVYKPMVESIESCSIYNFERINGTHFNYNVVYKLMNDYFDDIITKDVFVDRLYSTTQIYINE